MFSAKSFTGFIIPTLQWNILNYGRIATISGHKTPGLQGICAAVPADRAQGGPRGGGRAGGILLGTQQQAARLEESVREADLSVKLVVLQFEGGITDFNRVYNTQATLVTQQDLLATSARADCDRNLIQVYCALGGSWEHFLCGGDMTRMPAVDAIPVEGK